MYELTEDEYRTLERAYHLAAGQLLKLRTDSYAITDHGWRAYRTREAIGDQVRHAREAVIALRHMLAPFCDITVMHPLYFKARREYEAIWYESGERANWPDQVGPA